MARINPGRFVLCAFALWGGEFAPSVTAQGSTTRTVPFEEAVVLARRNAPDAPRAAAAAAVATAAATANRAERWPTLSLITGGGQRYGLAFDQTTGGLTQQTIETLDAGVQAQVVVFDGAARRGRLRGLEASAAASQASLDAAYEGAVLRALQQYADVEQAQAALAVAEADVVAQRQLLDEVEVQVELGRRPAAEGAQQSERVAASQDAVLVAARGVALAKARLARSLGLDPSGEYDFPLPASDIPDIGASRDSLVVAIVESRPQARAADLELASLLAQREAARAGRLPRISVLGSYGTRYTSANDETGLLGQFGDNRGGALGLRISVPVFDGGTSRAEVARYDALATESRALSRHVRQDLALAVEEIVIGLETSEERAALLQTRVGSAQAALQAEIARYEAGATTLQAVAVLRVRVVSATVDREAAAIEATLYRAILRLLAETQ